MVPGPRGPETTHFVILGTVEPRKSCAPTQTWRARARRRSARLDDDLPGLDRGDLGEPDEHGAVLRFGLDVRRVDAGRNPEGPREVDLLVLSGERRPDVLGDALGLEGQRPVFD